MTVAEQPKTKELIRVALPFPPNTNHMYRHVGYKTLLSAEARKYKEAVVTIIRRDHPDFVIPTRAPLEIEITLICPASKINTLDWDGHIKAVQDALFEASAIKANDAWIRKGTVEKVIASPDDKAGAVVVVLRVME